MTKLTQDLFDQLTSDIKDDIEAIMTYAGAGDDNTTPDPSDTALGNETFRDAVDEVDKASAADKITVSLRILTTENNGNDVKEAGTFNASSSGTLWLRDTLNSITKTSDINLFLDFEITITVEEDTS